MNCYASHSQMLDLSFYPLCQPGLMRGWGFICISEVSLNAAIMMIGLFKLRSVYGKKNKTPNSPSLKGIEEGGGRKKCFH